MYSLFYYRVPFSEVDAMGIVHHSNHAKYLERGRVEYLRLLDMNYVGITQRGLHLPLTDMSFSFKRPLFFDDIIVVETKLCKLTHTRLDFSYRILKSDALLEPELSSLPAVGSLLVSATTNHCCVNAQGKPLKLAPDIYEKLQNHLSEAKL